MLGGAGLGVGFGLAQMLVKDHRGGEVLAPAAAGVVCGKCAASVPPGKFCSSCGQELATREPAAHPGTFCTECGTPLGPDSKFCGQCGHQRS